MAFVPMDGLNVPPPDENMILNELETTPEGDKVFELIDIQEEKENEIDFNFYRNLAEDLSDSQLRGLAEDLLEEIENDKRARQQWDKTLSTGIKHLGFTVEEFRSIPFMNACAAFDTTLSSALYSAWAMVRAELYPSEGPAHIQVLGEENDELLAKAEKNKKFINTYLTVIDRSYYPDCDVHTVYTVFCGNGFKKVWQDPILCRPLSRNIPTTDLIVDPNCTSLLSSSRISYKFELQRQEIILKEEIGEFVHAAMHDINDVTNQDNSVQKAINRIDGVANDVTDNKNTFDYYECHTTRIIDGIKESGLPKGRDDELPLPYLVIIDIINRKVVKIVRNWKENDPHYKRKEAFTHSKYLPGFGLYGYGILHLLGSNSIALTSILRQAVDAGTYANFPAFIKMKGVKTEQNDKLIGPGEAHDIETGGAVRIQDAIMNLPYKGADPSLMTLRKELRDESKQPAGVAETQISDKHVNAPVGTLALLTENASIIQSSVMRCLHHTFSQELQLIYDCFRDHMGDEPFTFKTKGEVVTIAKEDFDDSLRIVPVSEADVDTLMQRRIKAFGLLQIAQSAPELHDMREVYHQVYTSMNVQNIDKILKPVKEAIPLDPITEVMNIMQGKPVKAAIWQDHQSHIIVLSTSPVADTPACKALIQEHESYDYLIKMQLAMGTELPPLEQSAKNPQIQNKIALMATSAAQQLAAQRQSNQEPTPQQVLMLDIEQRREAANLKNEETKLKVEADSAKAGLKFESEMAKIKADMEIAELKNDRDLELAEIKKKESIGLTALKNLFNRGKENERL